MTAGSVSKITVRGVSKGFVRRDRGKRAVETFMALEGVDIDVAEGEFIAIVGPSGCGKSTLLDIMAGLEPPTSGQVLLDGKPSSGASLDRGVVFQQYALFPWLTALANVGFPLESKGMPKAEAHGIARRYIALVGLEGFEDRYPHQLSGGMKQRIALARSLAYDPSILLMDEPFAALDAQTREVLQAELVEIWRQTHKTILFVTHGIDEAIYLGQKIAVMTSRPGRIKQIIDNPLAGRPAAEDVRGTPEFGRLRHEVWGLLRDEMDQAGTLRRRPFVEIAGSESADVAKLRKAAYAKPDRTGRLGRRGSLALVGGAVALGLGGLVRNHPTQASDLIPLRILGSGNGWSPSEIVVIAEQYGFFKEEGLVLDQIILPAEQLTISLDAGITDFVPNSYYIYFVNVKDKGLNGHQVVSTAPYLDARLPNGGLFVREDSPIHGPQDLRGKVIGLTVLQFASSWFTLAYLAKAGISAADVHLVAVPGPQHEQVLLRGDVDAVYTSGAVEATLLRKGGYRRIFTTAEVASHPITLGATIVKDDYIKRNPEIVRRYVTAIANSIDWANRNQDRIMHAAIKKGLVNADLAPFLYSPNGSGDYSLLRWPDHGLQSRDDVRFWIDLSEQIGIAQKGKFTPDDIYTDEFNPFAIA
jgi:NitT/TauT family transport system ATP-binding protein